ncbi:GEM-like protein 4 [Quillaja saponaria]|uniref:GEM-like protein 4 n=1 Tax=Quillaja saponaria TaxID=32244 RepID=A0AAD7KPD1_QUISA|nr:GEM-like protein 4 [Quillaja saponaria]
MQKGEKLLKITDCDLLTTVGPVEGFLLISTDKVTFSGDGTGHQLLIPIEAIKEANRGDNPIVPGQEYMEIVTEDYSKFRFTRFFRFEKSFNYLKKAINLEKDAPGM